MRASLTELEAVVAVARHRGFRPAARMLGISSSAISHAIAALEERLAVRLFNRTTRSVSLTSAGEELVGQIEPALGAIDAAVEGIGIHASEPNGSLRINMSHGAARLMLDPILLEYGRRYPKVRLEIVTDDALIDITAAGFDAGARLHDAIPPDMVAVPVFRKLRMIVVGSPAYLEGRERPLVPRDLAAHQCVQMRLSSGRLYRWEFERRGHAMALDVPGNLVFDASDLVLSAALAGAGLAYVEEKGARGHVVAGRLIQLLDEWTPPFEGLSLYFPGRRHLPPNLRALVDLIREVNAEFS
ncbi:LysR substrate-binding domain-containing protein [Flavisphingomonas formosensis]|uniref:LysR substrate-binding domain-containing protein n=1 Tax=Flavisphingomonas formosensis TaxID=861534 RepID=UPI0012FA97CF|nr:LysR substrate-binding domain-containing protein [Sphingomonas formosensis]